MPFKMNGGPALQAKITAIQKEFPDRIASAIKVEAEIEMTEAKRRTPVWNPARSVPKGTVPGLLRASGHVGEPYFDGNKVAVDLIFGGNGAEEYAFYVHEDLDADHAIGEAKFLESTLMESAPYMPERLARRLKLK